MSLISNFFGWANVDTKSAAYSIAGGDAGHLIYLDTNTTAVTIENDDEYDFPVGSTVGVVAANGVTGCTVVAGAGTTVNGGAAATTTAVTANTVIRLCKVAANTWIANAGTASAFA